MPLWKRREKKAEGAPTRVVPWPVGRSYPEPPAGARFDDVGGLEDAKEMMRRYVKFRLKRREILTDLRLDAGAAILIFGPRGCGKSLLMRAAANEFGIPHEFVQAIDLPGLGDRAASQRIEKTFALARSKPPRIVFIDDAHELFSKTRMDPLHRCVEAALGQIDRTAGKPVGLVFATDSPGVLDPRLLRLGRVDKMVFVPMPDHYARRRIFEIGSRTTTLDQDVDLDELAKRTDNFTGGDILLAIETATQTAGSGKPLRLAHLEEGIARVGPSVRGGETGPSAIPL